MLRNARGHGIQRIRRDLLTRDQFLFWDGLRFVPAQVYRFRVDKDSFILHLLILLLIWVRVGCSQIFFVEV
jgi:hypothetical protein